MLIFLLKDHTQIGFFPKIEQEPPSPKRLEEMLHQTKRKLEKNPNDLKALVDQGVIYFYLGNDHIADSLNSFHKAWQAGALDKRIFYFSGILYEELSLWEEAIKQYRKFLNHEPEDRQIRLRLAKILYQTGKLDEAIEEYEKTRQKK